MADKQPVRPCNFHGFGTFLILRALLEGTWNSGTSRLPAPYLNKTHRKRRKHQITKYYHWTCYGRDSFSYHNNLKSKKCRALPGPQRDLAPAPVIALAPKSATPSTLGAVAPLALKPPVARKPPVAHKPPIARKLLRPRVRLPGSPPGPPPGPPSNLGLRPWRPCRVQCRPPPRYLSSRDREKA